MKKLIKIISICAAVGAVVGAAFCFRDEISDFVKKIITKLEALKGESYNDCCFDDSYDDFDDFEDVETQQ